MPDGPRRIRSVDSVGAFRPRPKVAPKVIEAAPEPAQASGFVYVPTYTATPVAPVAPKVPKMRRGLPKKLALLGAALVIGVPAASFAALVLTHNRGKFSVTSLVVAAAKAAVTPEATLKGQSDDRTNIVIYGMTKDGLRTDSIMLASYYYKEKKLVTVNIPRDLYVWDGYENCKFGEVYAYAVARRPKNPSYPSQFVSDLLAKEYGIPVHYWAKFNMQGEVDLINALDGVDITAPDSFTDYEYPTWNYTGYIRPAPHFLAGPQHMNGDRALIYSRSRHSLDNGEGTDFARSKRQQLVVQAIMTRVKGLGIVGNLSDISHYLTILGNNVDTSMSTDEMVSFASILKNFNEHTDYLQANWSVGNGFLCSSTSDYGAYVTLYGTEANCGTQAGLKKTSVYRQDAITYVKNMLASAAPTPSPSVSPAVSSPATP